MSVLKRKEEDIWSKKKKKEKRDRIGGASGEKESEGEEEGKEPVSHLVTEAGGIIIANPLIPLVGIWNILIINPVLSCSLDKGANLSGGSQ